MSQEPRLLQGHTALVTGASRGIGRAIAIRLAEAGADLAITARGREGLAETRRQIEDRGGRCALATADVASPADVAAVVAAVTEEIGELDIVVNNAGRATARTTQFCDHDAADWWNLVEVNLRGPMLVTAAALPGMLARGRGRVLNIGSFAGSRALPGFSAYSVSKAALTRMSECLAGELAGSGVSVFEVSPGLVHTQMTDGFDAFEGIPEEEWTPIERIAEVVVDLCSGRYDALAGRFLHATDDLDALLATVGAAGTDARTLRLQGAGSGDALLD